jgi:hypothetical protein
MLSDSRRRSISGVAATLSVPLQGVADATLAPRVEVEETIYDFTPAGNGATPLWAFGSPLIVRRHETVFVAGLDTIAGVKPLNNCRWVLHRRDKSGWTRVLRDEKGLQREPCPIGMYDDGRLMLSSNPTLTARDTYNGPADPQLLVFESRDLQRTPKVLRPLFSGKPRLTEHTYRGMAVDGRRNELVMLHNDGTGAPEAHWLFLDPSLRWRNQGVIRYPIRGCYPLVALRNRKSHVFAVGDIREPVEPWRKWKFEQSGGQQWDFVFRRLFYVANHSVDESQFGDVVEIENVDATAGHLRNLDLWLARDGVAHLLYLKRTVASLAMRDRFFPGVPVTVSLIHAVLRGGRVERRQTLFEAVEEQGTAVSAFARFHACAPRRLFVLACLESGNSAENRLFTLAPDGSATTSMRVALKHTFTIFFTATERGGSRPSNVLDVMGIAEGAEQTAIRYARIRLF